jgi:hypothetical protein
MKFDKMNLQILKRFVKKYKLTISPQLLLSVLNKAYENLKTNKKVNEKLKDIKKMEDLDLKIYTKDQLFWIIKGTLNNTKGKMAGGLDAVGALNNGSTVLSHSDASACETGHQLGIHNT